jgi:hypothetical protein
MEPTLKLTRYIKNDGLSILFPVSFGSMKGSAKKQFLSVTSIQADPAPAV